MNEAEKEAIQESVEEVVEESVKEAVEEFTKEGLGTNRIVNQSYQSKHFIAVIPK